MKRYLLIIMMMVCAVTGAWADGASKSVDGSALIIETNDDPDLATFTIDIDNNEGWMLHNKSEIRIVGDITQSGLTKLGEVIEGLSSTWAAPAENSCLVLSGARFQGNINTMPQLSKINRVIFPIGKDLSNISFPSNYAYAYSGPSAGIVNVYVASGTTSVPELTDEIINNATTIYVSGDGAATYISTLTPEQQEKCSEPFNGRAEAVGGSVSSDVNTILTDKGVTAEQVKQLTITSGTISNEDVTYITSSLTGLTTLNLSGATASGEQVYDLMTNTPAGCTITLSDAQKTALKSVSGKTFTADLLSKAGMTVDDLVTGMTTANYIVDGTTLIVTGNIDSTVDTQIASVLNTYNTVTTLDVSKATNTTDYEIAAKTGITLVKLPGSGKVTYAGNATVLTNGSLTIAIGNGAGEYASVSDALTALSTTLSSSDVQHVKVTGALSTADLGNIHSLGSNVKTIDLSEATLANGAAWTDLTGDFSNAGVLLPTGATPGTTTNANIFIINGNFLTATKNVAETFDAELSFFSETTGKALLTTSSTTAIISGVLDNTALANISSLTEYTRIDLSGATIATGASIDNLQIPSALEQLVLPKDQTVSSTLATTLAAANNLWYAYSPSSDCSATGPNQTDSYDGTKNTIADYVWVVKADGLAKAFTNEEQLRNSFYIKVASSVALSNTDVDFNGLDANKPTNYLFLDFSESNLTPSVAAHYTVTDDIGYRIILPDGWTADQMAVFAALPQTAASGPARGNIAAVYSYNGTRLDIMEITDATYMPTALSNPRIVRAGTTALQVVSGSYNGSVYSACGDHLIAAINGAQSSITSVKINTGKNFLNNTTYAANFTNPNITSLDLSGIDITYVENNNLQSKTLSVNGCSKLQTLNLSNAAIGSVDAAVSSLTNVNLTGTSIYGYANFSGASLATAFTTTSATSFFGALTLTNTGLTAFSTAAKVSGDINLSGSSSLASVNLLQTQFKNQWKQDITDSKIHIHKTNDENDTYIIEKLKVSESIQVPTGFNKEKRICPYTAASSYIKEAEYIAPACEFTDTDMYLHEPEEAADGDKLVYWYQGDMRTGEVANINVSTTNSLATTITNNAKLGTGVVKAKIAGDVSSTDVASLKDINATVLDLSQATFDETAWTALKTAFAAKGTGLHANTKFVILPSTATREDIINPTALAGLTNIWSVIATKENNTATNNVMHQPLGNGYDFTSYTRVAGTLQAATVQTLTSSTADYTRTPNIGGTPTSKRVYLSNVSNFRDLKISGIVNAYDLCKSTTVDQNGHLKWNRSYTEAAIEPAGRTLVGQDVYGPFGSCFNLTAIDLEYATFVNDGTTDYVTDMTLSALNVLSSNATKKVVIPTDPSVKEIPADFMNSAIEIDAICIPYNIERIRSRAFNTIDYVWTTSWTGSSAKDNTDPEGANTKLDNGAEYTSGNTVTLAYATNWDGDKQVKSDFDYTLEPTGGSYTFSSNLKVIESGAFANTRPHVKDVYVLNAVAPECHVDAFNTNMYVGNGGYDPVIKDGIITRDSYKNGGFWITMLHYPRQTVTPNVQRYTDPTRSYSIATGDRDGKGGTLYYPNQSEFIRAYTQGTYGYTWNAWNPAREYGSVNNGAFANLTLSAYNSTDQANANTNFNTYTTGGDNHKYTSFYDLTANGTTTKPSTIVDYDNIYWDESSYSTSGTPAQQLYPQSKDYRGWHQFVLYAYASNTILDVEEFRSYITDNEWWTFCPTFDITRKQAITLFGTPKVEFQPAVGEPGDENYKPAVEAVEEKIPFISKLLYVRRDYDSNTIALNFSKNLMLNKEDRVTSTVTVTKDDDGVITAVTNASQHGNIDDKGVYIINASKPADNDVVMSAGVPYMIKPHMPNGNIRLFQIYATQDEADKMIAQYEAAGRDMSTLPFKYIVDETLYGVMHFAQERSGSDQRTLVQTGLYSVPVFVKGTAKPGVTKESTDGIEYTISGVKYNKSLQWKYSFVGSFYQSFLPGNCYFLGWDSKNKRAKFFYNDRPDANVMRWTNETGVICPTAPDYTFTITPASGKDPAQWKIGKTIGEKTTDEKYGIETYWLSDDSFSTSGGSSAKTYDQFFDSPEVFSVVVDGIGQIYSSKAASTSEDVTVYSIDGQLVGKSLRGLPKGIYVVDGKKYVVK